MNSFGDEQLAVDMLADKLLFEVGLGFPIQCVLNCSIFYSNPV